MRLKQYNISNEQRLVTTDIVVMFAHVYRRDDTIILLPLLLYYCFISGVKSAISKTDHRLPVSDGIEMTKKKINILN